MCVSSALNQDIAPPKVDLRGRRVQVLRHQRRTVQCCDNIIIIIQSKIIKRNWRLGLASRLFNCCDGCARRTGHGDHGQLLHSRDPVKRVAENPPALLALEHKRCVALLGHELRQGQRAAAHFGPGS